MKKFISYPKIGQFRNTIKHITDRTRYVGKDKNGDAIFDPTISLPTLTFQGTVKSHGTNAGVTMNREGEIWAQSRENIITIEKDNAGFAFFVEANKETFKNLFKLIDFEDADYITIFGEWCGGNIQKNVAINGLDKMFIVFAVKLSYDDVEKTNRYNKDFSNIKSNDNKIYNIEDFKTFTIDIDFNNPKESQDELIEIMLETEKECPIGKSFGKNGLGEGNVWKCYSEDGSLIQFKVKGEKHAGKSKIKKQIVDVEKLNTINEFVDYTVTEGRLNQGLEKIFINEEIDIKKLGQFLKWINDDVLTEESDTLIESKLEPKDVKKALSTKARKWFLEKWNNI